MTPSLPAFVGSLPVLVVAPHLDDALLSAFALATSGTSTSVLTVFDGEPERPVVTSWDLVCSLRDSAEAMALRRAENDEAMRRSGCAHHSLGLIDQQYLDGPRPAAEADKIREAVRSWLNEVGNGIVAVPAGAGAPPPTSAVFGTPGGARRRRLRQLVGPAGQALLNARARWMARNTLPAAHVDHLFVRDALVPLAQEGCGVVLYEEVPYLWGAPADRSVTDLVGQHGLRALEVTAGVDLAHKARCVGAYGTQVELLYSPHGRLDTISGLPETERYWLLTALSAAGPSLDHPRRRV